MDGTTADTGAWMSVGGAVASLRTHERYCADTTRTTATATIPNHVHRILT